MRDDWQRDPVGTLRRCAELGLQGVELYGDSPLPIADLKQTLDALGLKTAAAHVGDSLNLDLPRRLREARELGHQDLVWSFPAAPFANDADMQTLAQAAQAQAQSLAGQGFRMCLHHHPWEFVSMERGRRYLDLCAAADLEFDLYWLQTAGLDPVAMVRQYAPRVRLLHAKDGPALPGLPMTALGEGVVNIHGAISAALQANAPLEWVLIELDECATDVWGAVQKSKTYLDALPI